MNSTGLLIFGIVVILVCLFLYWYVRLIKKLGKAHIAEQEQKARLSLQLHPTYRQKVEEDRVFTLASRRLAIEEREAQARIQLMLAEFAHKQHLDLTRVPPETYLLEQPPIIIPLPSLKRPAEPEKTQETDTSPIYQQPPLETIITELTPNALEFIYGLDPLTGETIKTTLPQAVHIQLLGASGQGKSRQATSILTQLASRNDPQHVQLAIVDCEGETTPPFHHLPHVRYLADNPRAAAKILHTLTQELERRDRVKIIFPVILIFVEEFLNLRRIMPAEYRDSALEDFTTLALRGRKRGMFLFSIGQTAYTERAIRDAQMQFLSSMAFAIKPTAARSAGFTNTELLNKLYSERRPGQFLLERPAGDSILLSPYVDTDTIPAILHRSESQVRLDESQRDTDPLIAVNRNPIETQSNVNRKPMRNPIDPALEAKLAHVLTLLQQGVTNKADIILAVWDKRPGKSEVYKQAEEEYTRIMQHISTLVTEKGA